MRDLREGDAIGRYQLERTIDRGAFGRVWRALDTSTGKYVAIKVLASEDGNEEHARARTDLERLAAAAARDSRHIVRVLDSGHQPAPHIVMEFIDGTNLRDELSDRGCLPQEEVIRIGLQVADALRALHRVRVVHRDVKPANILLDQQGEVRLTDFGIAKILGYDETVTLTQQNLLSAPYAAPEVWEGAPNPHSDIYAFGAVLYEMLAGRPPFQGDLMDLFRQHRSDEPDLGLLPAHTAPSLRELVYLCLRKNVDERPPDAETAIAMLERAREELRREPDRFGPWRVVSHHPTLAWAWLCRHEKTDEEATVEVHFAEDEAFGQMLRAAVNVNPKLVPLGTEAVLGANRLLLADDEGWPNAPQHNLVFWLAREEREVGQPDVEFNRLTLLRATEAFVRVIDVANSGGVRLSIDAERAVVLEDGSIFVRRPGLPPLAAVEPRLGAFILLRSLPMNEEAAALAASARDLRDLREKLSRPRHLQEAEGSRGGRSLLPRFVLGASMAAIAAIAVAAVLLLRADSGQSNGNAVLPPTPPPEVCGGGLTLPAPIDAARRACGAQTAFQFAAECPRGQVCSVEARNGVTTLSGNDQTIAFVDSSGDLYLARESDYAAKRLLQDGHVREPAWSPDGRYIAYILAKPDGNGTATELWILDTQDPASGARVFVSSDAAGTPDFKKRQISEPHWSADGRSLYFLWQPAEAAPEVWSIELPERNGELDTRELRTWGGSPRNLNQTKLPPVEGVPAPRLSGLGVAPDGTLLAEICGRDGACGFGSWSAEGLRMLAAPAPGARFISPVRAGDRVLALAIDGPDAILLQIDDNGGITPLARLPAGQEGSFSGADLSLAVAADGNNALIGTPTGVSLVSLSAGNTSPAFGGKWAAWLVPSAPAVALPEPVPFATPVLTPSPVASPSQPAGADADLAVEIVAASCAQGQELVVTVRNLGPSVLDRDVFLTVRSLADNGTRVGNSNKGLTGLQPGQVREVRTGYFVREAVQVQIDNPRDRRPDNNVATCTPR